MNNSDKLILGGLCIFAGCAIGNAIQSIRKLILTKKITKTKKSGELPDGYCKIQEYSTCHNSS